MSHAHRAAGWPFPGLVWGDYPQRALPLEGLARSRPWGRARLEKFARAAAQGVECGAQEDPVSRSLLAAREAMVAALGVVPRWQQLMAARALLEQRLVEMDTGEGKTLAIALAAAAAARAGTPVHVVTSNDYLAQRDAQDLAPFYSRLGLRCAFVAERMAPDERRAAYACDVAYVTGRELAFDYLRDSLHGPPSGAPLQQRLARMEAPAGARRVLRGLCFAILDEADTLLVDEARMPFVLAQAGGREGEAQFHRAAWSVACAMQEPSHFRISADGARVRLLPAGRTLLADWPHEDADALHAHESHREAAVVLALTAAHVLRAGRDYVVKEGGVALVDQASGRLSQGRAWSRGLHQMVEIKEGLVPSDRNETVARITYQRFFARYLRLAGTSGTLREARSELARVYGLALVRVPAHEPRRVAVGQPRLFADSGALWAAVADRAAGLAAEGRPVLVGVGSVVESRALCDAMREKGIAHQVLDAEHDDRERAVLQAAGRAGCITVATSMAGRGSHIALDEQALRAGGLHVLLCQLNESGRNDRQFLGRAGRQGQPGTAEQWLAVDFDGFKGLPVVLRRALLLSSARSAALKHFLLLRQAVTTYTRMKQRVTLLRAAEAEERDLAFSRNLLI